MINRPAEHEIEDPEVTAHALACAFRRELKRAQQRFDAGEFSDETYETAQAVLEALADGWFPWEHRLRREYWSRGWRVWWRQFQYYNGDLARVIRDAVIDRVLARERVA